MTIEEHLSNRGPILTPDMFVPFFNVDYDKVRDLFSSLTVFNQEKVNSFMGEFLERKVNGRAKVVLRQNRLFGKKYECETLGPSFDDEVREGILNIVGEELASTFPEVLPDEGLNVFTIPTINLSQVLSQYMKNQELVLSLRSYRERFPNKELQDPRHKKLIGADLDKMTQDFLVQLSQTISSYTQDLEKSGDVYRTLSTGERGLHMNVPTYLSIFNAISERVVQEDLPQTDFEEHLGELRRVAGLINYVMKNSPASKLKLTEDSPRDVETPRLDLIADTILERIGFRRYSSSDLKGFVVCRSNGQDEEYKNAFEDGGFYQDDSTHSKTPTPGWYKGLPEIPFKRSFKITL